MTVKVYNRTKGHFVDKTGGAITLGSLEAVPTETLLGRISAGTGSVETLTVAQVKELLDILGITTAGFNAKAPLASPDLTGTPTAPTATAGTNSNQIASTAFVYNAFAAINTHYVGSYLSFSALMTAHPTGSSGDYAIVDSGIGSDAQIYIWDDDDGLWVLSSGGASIATTDALAEGSVNLYFTVSRVLAAVLTGFNPSPGTVSATDSVLVAINKIVGNIDAVGIGKQSRFYPALAFSNGSTTAAFNTAAATYDFSTSVAQDVLIDDVLPKAWNAGSVSFRVIYTQPTTSAGGVAWGVKIASISDGDSISPSYGTQVVVTDTAGTGSVNYCTDESNAVTVGNSPAKNDRLRINLQRVVSNAADTMGQNAQLIGLVLYYLTDASTDA